MIRPSKLRDGLLLVVFLLLGAPLHSAELREIEVEREEGNYRMTSVSWLDVNPEALYEVLANHDLFTRFTGAMVESRNEEPDEAGRPQFYSRFEGCVIVYCKSFIRNGYLELEPITKLVAIVDPERSDFQRSHETWTLTAEGDGTVMTYEFDMVPDFWVPPVIGPYYIKRALKRGGEKAIKRIEALVHEREMTSD